MDLTGSSKQPWVDWVNARERQMKLLSSVATMRIDEGLRVPRGISQDKDIMYRCSLLGSDQSVPFVCKREAWKTNSLSWYQQEQVLRDVGQQRRQLRRSPLLNRERNRCSHLARSVDNTQLLSRWKSCGSAVHKVTANFVTTRASRASCHVKPACSETRYTRIESSDVKLREYAVESVESGLGMADPQDQGIRLSEVHGAETVRASKPHDQPKAVLAQSENHQVVESVRCQSAKVLSKRRLKESDRPTISWLNAPKENAVPVRQNKFDVGTTTQFYACSQSSKGHASNSKDCAACGDSVILQQVQLPEAVYSGVRKHVDWHLPQRGDLRLRKRERTRSGLLCRILGVETSETERRGTASSDRCTSGHCAVDLRLNVQRKSSKEKRQYIRPEQTPSTPLVVSLAQLLMDLISDVGGSCREAPAHFQCELEDGMQQSVRPGPSVQCQTEHGLVEACQGSYKKEDMTTPSRAPSKCRRGGIGAFTTVPRDRHEFLRRESNESNVALDECSIERYDPDEDDEKLSQRVVEMQSLADKVGDALLLDVAVELTSVCTSIVDNLIFREFGIIG